MPSAPPVIYTPPSAGSPPDAPEDVFTPPSAGSPPDAPEGVFTAPASAAPVGMSVTGITSAWPGNGYYEVGGTANGKDFYRYGIYRLQWTGTAWVFVPDSGMLTYFTSSEDVATPDLVTEWTAVTGTGPVRVFAGPEPAVPVFTPPSAGSPPDEPGGVFTPPSAGDPPDAPGAVFTPPSAGSPPSAPGGVFTPPSAGAAPSAPPPVFGMLVHGLYNTDYSPLRNTDDTLLGGTEEGI